MKFIGLIVAVMPLSAVADLSVSGTVRVWDDEKRAYVAARGAQVRVEVDALCENPVVETDDSGRYTAAVAAPLAGESKVAVRVAARNPRVAVFSEPWSFAPIAARSQPVMVAPGDTRAIDVTIGGAEESVAEHLLSKEKLAHEAIGIASLVRDTAMALAKATQSQAVTFEPVAYYPAPTVVAPGYLSFARIGSDGGSTASLRHDLAHLILSSVYSFIPSTTEAGAPGHGVDTPEGAWREGFMAFVECLSNADKVQIDDCASDKGSVLAILRDIVNPVGERKFAKQHADAPEPLTWRDSIEDKDFAKGLGVVKDRGPSTLAPGGGGESFFEAYVAASGQVHELKTIFFHNGVTVASRPENAPHVRFTAIARPTKPKKKGKKAPLKTTVEFEIVEADEEDRPFARWTLFLRETGEKDWVRVAAGKWAGDTKTASTLVSQVIERKDGFPEGTALRVVVNDEMEAAVDTFTFPEKVEAEGETPFGRGLLFDNVKSSFRAAQQTPSTDAAAQPAKPEDDPVASPLRAIREALDRLARAYVLSDDVRYKLALVGFSTKHLAKQDLAVATRVHKRAREERVSFGRLVARPTWSENYQNWLDRATSGMLSAAWIAGAERATQQAAADTLVKRIDEADRDAAAVPATLKEAAAAMRDKAVVDRVARLFPAWRTQVEAMTRGLPNVHERVARAIPAFRGELAKLRRAVAGIRDALQ